MAVGHDRGAFRQPRQLADRLGRLRHAWTREERAHLDVFRTRYVPLARVARVACPARELLLPADIDECERRVAEAAAELGQRRERLEPRRQLGTGAVELDDARFEVALPAGQAAGEH